MPFTLRCLLKFGFIRNKGLKILIKLLKITTFSLASSLLKKYAAVVKRFKMLPPSLPNNSKSYECELSVHVWEVQKRWLVPLK